MINVLSNRKAMIDKMREFIPVSLPCFFFHVMFTLLQRSKLSVDELSNIQRELYGKINNGEYDEEFAGASSIMQCVCFLIIKEKMFDGESKTEKDLLKKARKAKKFAEAQK